MICETFSKSYGINWTNRKEQTAVADENGSITYEELEKEITRVSVFLLSLDVRKEDRIFIYIGRKKEFLILMLGILQAGACFVPLNQEMKVEEAEKCFRENQGCYIFTENLEIIRRLPGRALEYGDIPFDISTDMLFPSLAREDLAYIMFTSGTTGEKKGVMIEHQAVWNLVDALHERIYEKELKTLCLGVTASFSFDASLKQIFYSVFYGHTLVIIPDRVKHWGREYISFLNQYKIEVTDMTPSIISVIAMDKRREKTVSLNKILVGGEILTPDIVKKAYECFGEQISIYNLYGPTECCVDASAYKVRREDVLKEKTCISIGKPLKNIYFELKDKDADGIGEIYIRGLSVGRGYTDSEAGFGVEDGERVYKTGDYALIHDNRYYVVGRKDRQVKIRGIRIELEEIDSCIQKMSGIVFSYTMLHKGISRDMLITFVESECVTKREIIEFLRDKYPDYMIPNQILLMNGIKLNANGKIDQKYYMELYRQYMDRQ